MNKTVKIILSVIGVIILLLLIAIMRSHVTDSQSLKQTTANHTESTSVNSYSTGNNSENTPSSRFTTQPRSTQNALPSDAFQITEDRVDGTNLNLSSAHKKTLETFGVDPASIPTSISASQEECLVAKFGRARVDQVLAGASPSTAEIIKGKSCF